MSTDATSPSTIDLTADWMSSTKAEANNHLYLEFGTVQAYLEGVPGPLGPVIPSWDDAVAAWQAFSRWVAEFSAECQQRGMPQPHLMPPAKMREPDVPA
jgi:hypothetical protein